MMTTKSDTEVEMDIDPEATQADYLHQEEQDSMGDYQRDLKSRYGATGARKAIFKYIGSDILADEIHEGVITEDGTEFIWDHPRSRRYSSYGLTIIKPTKPHQYICTGCEAAPIGYAQLVDEWPSVEGKE